MWGPGEVPTLAHFEQLKLRGDDPVPAMANPIVPEDATIPDEEVASVPQCTMVEELVVRRVSSRTTKGVPHQHYGEM